MLLARAQLQGVGPLDDLVIPFVDAVGAPRLSTVIFGGGGVGKTSLLAAIAQTRPGLAAALTRTRDRRPGQVVTHWALGQDDPARPHPLRITSPNAPIDEGEGEDAGALRRREQALFERRAADGGFVLLTFSAARWFSRTPLVLTAPDRTLDRYDVRAPASFDDATRADLTRETKQALSFAPIAAALARGRTGRAAERLALLDRAMGEVLSVLLGLAGHGYLGADPASLEPLFQAPGGDPVLFDDLPTAARHLAAFGALTVRALYAAYPARAPRAAEGVVLIDEAGLHQDPSAERRLLPALREALPAVQWILTSSSPALALGAEPRELLALRRLPPSRRVVLHEGPLATVH